MIFHDTLGGLKPSSLWYCFRLTVSIEKFLN